VTIWKENSSQILRSATLNGKKFTKVNVLYWPLKFYDNCIENTFINANTDTVEAKEKKEAAKKKRCEREKRKRDEKKATVPAKRIFFGSDQLS
jgi:hypothetical protein